MGILIVLAGVGFLAGCDVLQQWGIIPPSAPLGLAVAPAVGGLSVS